MNETIFTFPNGLPGFEDCKKFELYHEQKNNLNLYQLHSVDQEEIAFNLVDPAAFDLNYQFTLTDDEQERLEAKSIDDLMVLLMIYKKENAGSNADLRANIAGPLVINVNSQKGIQKILNKVDYSVNMMEK